VMTTRRCWRYRRSPRHLRNAPRAGGSVRGISLAACRRAACSASLVKAAPGSPSPRFAVTRLLDRAGSITGGRIRFDGRDITKRAGGRELRRAARCCSVHDLPESARCAESHPRHRPADRRRHAARIAVDFHRRGPRKGRRATGSRPHPRGRKAPCRRLSPRVVRRHVPARDDRHGHGLRTGV
jgi:hypothetical protein